VEPNIDHHVDDTTQVETTPEENLLVPLTPANITPQFTTHLPKLSLPTFAGSTLTWQTFWYSFSDAMHTNISLSGVQKFNYLRAQLSDEASKSIAGFPLTDNNYDHSIAILKERSGETSRIVNAHMQALLALPNSSNTIHSF